MADNTKMYKKDSGSGHVVLAVELKNSPSCSSGKPRQHLTVKSRVAAFLRGKQIEWRLLIEPGGLRSRTDRQPRNRNKTFKIKFKGKL